MITVIGKFCDIEPYIGRAGYNVMPFMADWSPEANRAWIDAALDRGDQILIASNDYSGEFLNELIYLFEKLSQKGENAPKRLPNG